MSNHQTTLILDRYIFSDTVHPKLIFSLKQTLFLVNWKYLCLIFRSAYMKAIPFQIRR